MIIVWDSNASSDHKREVVWSHQRITSIWLRTHARDVSCPPTINDLEVTDLKFPRIHKSHCLHKIPIFEFMVRRGSHERIPKRHVSGAQTTITILNSRTNIIRILFDCLVSMRIFTLIIHKIIHMSSKNHEKNDYKLDLNWLPISYT